jgi:hypothetical protein
MKRITKIWTARLSCTLLAFSVAFGQKASEPASITEQYCVSCHNNGDKTANFSLEDADLKKIAPQAELWEKVLRKVRASEMPPAKMPQPTAVERKAFIALLEKELDSAAVAHPNPGRPVIHRLNRTEYSNAIRDLLALDIDAGKNLPQDDTGYGFDNIGDVLSLSPVRIERFMSTAAMVSRLAMGSTDIKPAIDTFDALYEIRNARTGQRLGRNERYSDDLPFNSAGGLSFHYAFPVDGDYVFKIKMAGSTTVFTETAPPVGDIFELTVPVKAGIRHVGMTFMRTEALDEVIPGAGGGRRGGTPATSHLDLRLDGARLKLYNVPEGRRGREVVDMSIAGPYNIKGPGNSASRQKILICKPAAGAEQPCARRIISSLGRRAFRRPFTESDLKPLMAFYEAGRKERGFDYGIELALRAMLVSPNFLFRIERDPAGAKPGSVHRINDFELASRLSFFVWSSIPDEELLSLAQLGRLRNPVVLRQQLARMLDDEKSKAFVTNFAGQWLLLRNLEQVKPDPDAYAQWDDNLRMSFQQETELLFNAIVRENLPVTDILNAKFTFLNQRLADFYGVPGVYGSRFRRVEMTGSKRTGLLGHASVLTVTSYPTRTSVVMRGKWVLESLLGSPPPPPPPDVPDLNLKPKERVLSMREAMELHRANPICASCHSKMDPLGFALENYDAIGGWREKENGAAIDSLGKLPDGTEIHGAGGLAEVLSNQYREEFLLTFTDKLMTYALGRGLESYDQPTLRTIVRQTAKDRHTVPALIRAVVESPQFLMRRTADQ